MRVLLIDNYDSFTFNLAQAFQVLGAEVQVFRNDTLSLDDARALQPTHLVISPGPGMPDSAGMSLAMIEGFLGTIPILGVCLGHQALVQVLGGKIIRAPELMHGKSSPVSHDGRTLFTDLPHPLEVGRYHSLIAESPSLPDVLEVSCHTEDGIVMGVRYPEVGAEGVQFHPESVLTPDGDALLANFLKPV